MKLGDTGLTISSAVPTDRRRRVEKPNASSTLERNTHSEADHTMANFRKTDKATASRFETQSPRGDFEIHPACGFIAQILGQILPPSANAAYPMHAYARARAYAPRPIKFA